MKQIISFGFHRLPLSLKNIKTAEHAESQICPFVLASLSYESSLPVSAVTAIAELQALRKGKENNSNHHDISATWRGCH